MSTRNELFLNKENALPYPSAAGVERKRVRASTSTFSLRSLMNDRRTSALDQIQVSQPTLDGSSREKVRSKVKQSPSMMSLNGPRGQPELVHESETRLVNELLQMTPDGEFEGDLARSCRDSDDIHYDFYDLNYTNAQDLIQMLKIHQMLSRLQLPDQSCFVPIESVHMEQRNDGSFLCVTATRQKYLDGIRLDRLKLSNAQESVQILLKITQLLAYAEQHLRFEHRNLHAGNILVHQNPRNYSISHITIINCELGRIEPQSLYTSLDHPSFYRARLPVLNEMRRVVPDPQRFYPITNVLWLSYVARYLHHQFPCSDVKRLESILDPPKWKLRRRPRSARETATLFAKQLKV